MPRHKAMQSAEFADLLDAWAQIEVIGISEKNSDAEFFEDVLWNTLDRGQRSHGHEDRSLHFAVWSQQASGAGRAGGGINLELKGHQGIVAMRKELSVVRKLPHPCSLRFWSDRVGEQVFALCVANIPSRYWVRQGKSMISAFTLPALTMTFPTLTGKLNLLGPALPGLKYSAPFFVSCLPTWLCP